METTAQKSSPFQTIGAIPLALVTWAAVDLVAVAVGYFIYRFLLLSFIPDAVPMFIANVVGGALGVMAAKSLTEKWLPRHNGKPVAIALFAFCAIIITAALFLPNRHGEAPISVSAGMIATIIGACQFFWLGGSARA